MRELWQQNYEAFRKSEPYAAARNNYNNYIRKRNDYSGAVLYADIVHADYSEFNRILAQEGFPPLGDIGFRLGFGFSHKRDHAIWDMYLGILGVGRNKSRKGNETIATSFSNSLQIDLGYDILRQERFSLYPFAGASLRISHLSYSKSGEDNSTYTSLANMRTDENHVDLESFRIGYQYGAGFDYAFAYNKEKTFKTILFLKAGVSRPFKVDTYKNEDIPDYKPGIKQGDWLVAFGLKFGNKR